jgi:hypothetical protein
VCATAVADFGSDLVAASVVTWASNLDTSYLAILEG